MSKKNKKKLSKKIKTQLYTQLKNQPTTEAVMSPQQIGTPLQANETTASNPEVSFKVPGASTETAQKTITSNLVTLVQVKSDLKKIVLSVGFLVIILIAVQIYDGKSGWVLNAADAFYRFFNLRS